MATKSIGRLVLYEPLDQAKINSLLASNDTVFFEIERRYELDGVPDLLSAVLPNQFNDPEVDYVDALKKIIDAASFIHEENVVNYKINYNPIDKVFDLNNSYIRNLRDTASVMTSVPSGQLLSAFFITPGLEGNVFTTIELPFGESISSIDRDKLSAVGLVLNLSATGSLFSFKTRSVPFKLFFSKPASVISQKYSIEFNYQNQIIEI